MRLPCGCDAEKCAQDPGLCINYCNDYIFIADRNGIMFEKVLDINRRNITHVTNNKARKQFERFHARLFRLLDTRFPGGWRVRETFAGAEGLRVIYEPQAEGWNPDKQEPYIAFGLDEEYNLTMIVCDKPAREWYADTETEAGRETDPMAKYAGIPLIDFRDN